MLAPIYLLGALAARHHPQSGWILPFLLVHVGLYGGATAFNSFYDQDRGPIGFWKRPRPATTAVRDLALALQVLCVVLLLRWGLPVAGIALVMLLMGAAYSHPLTRWKASPWGGIAAVALGQGAGALLLGFYATGGSGLPRGDILLLALGAALATAGLYPVTQIYQIDEDRSRGDVTLPVRYGWRATLWLSGVVASLGIWALAASLRPLLTRSWTRALALTPLPLGGIFVLWGRRFERQSSLRNHDWAMAVGAGAAAIFWLICAAALAAAASDPNVRVWDENKITRVNATTLAACSPQQAWDVILDYPEIPRYQELVDSSYVISEHGGTTLVHQEGTGTFIITKRLRFDLEFRRLDPETVAFHQVKGDFAAFDGTWSVVPESSGVRIRFASSLRSGLPLPGFILRRILRRHAIAMMPALAAEIARRYPRG